MPKPFNFYHSTKKRKKVTFVKKKQTIYSKSPNAWSVPLSLAVVPLKVAALWWPRKIPVSRALPLWKLMQRLWVPIVPTAKVDTASIPRFQCCHSSILNPAFVVAYSWFEILIILPEKKKHKKKRTALSSRKNLKKTFEHLAIGWKSYQSGSPDHIFLHLLPGDLCCFESFVKWL